MADIKVGDRVYVVEHDETSRTPADGGLRLPAQVVAVEGLYVQVSYENEAINGGRPDAFWKESLWMAWDGAFRWRLMTDSDAEEA